MSIEILGKILQPDEQIYEFSTLCIDGKFYRIGDKYGYGIIRYLKAKMDYSEPIAVVEEGGIINHYELG